MPIFGAVDVLSVSSHNRGDSRAPSDADAPAVMQLLADGVPLELLVDIALPFGLICDLAADLDRGSRW